MVVLHLITSLEIGGAQIALYRLLADVPTEERGNHRVIMMIAGDGVADQIRALGIDVQSLGLLRGALSLRALYALWRILPKQPFILHAWMYHANLLATLIAFLPPWRGRVIWSVHNALDGLHHEKPMTQKIIRLSAYLSRLPAAIVYVGERVRQQHEAIGYHKKHGHVIPHGYNGNAFAPYPTAKAELCQQFGLPFTSTLVGIFGRYNWAKDYPTFIAALAQVPHLTAIMVGSDVDKQTNSALAALLSAAGVENRVLTLGYRSDTAFLMAAMDMVCVSSLTEAGPMVIGEAMACGTPCVSTDVGDAALMIGDTGWIVPTSDAAALALALQHATHAPDLKVRGKRARARILSYYKDTLTHQRYFDLYQVYEGRAAKRKRV